MFSLAAKAASSGTSARSGRNSPRPWTRRAGDCPPAHPDRARVAIGPFAGAATVLPLPAELFGLCDHRFVALWRRAGQLACPETNLPLPPMGRPGLRPGSLKSNEDLTA